MSISCVGVSSATRLTESLPWLSGVHWRRDSGKWIARLALYSKDKDVGYFEAAEEAAHAYDRYEAGNNHGLVTETAGVVNIQ